MTSDVGELKRLVTGPRPALAPRSVRALASLLDLMIAVPLFLLALAATVSAFGFGIGALEKKGIHPGLALGTAASTVVAVAGWTAFAVLVLYQWYLLATRGQTIGKRALSIRVTDLDGQPAGLIRALVLRAFVFGSLISFVAGALSPFIPFASLALAVIDVVLVFGPDRRCLHDYVAGTQVRWVKVFEVRVGRVVAVGSLGAGLMAGGAFLLLRPASLPALPVIAAPVAPALAPMVRAPIAPGPTPAAPIVEPPKEPAREIGDAVPAPERGVWRFTDKDGIEHYVDDQAAIPKGVHATRVE